MLRAFLGALLFLLPVGLVSGQSFPSDGKSPAKASGAELLEAVCSGQVVVVGDKIGCGKEYLYFTGFADDELDWSLTGVTRGHFLSPTSDDAVLSAEGCEPHVANFGGTILLTRSFQGWVMEWYKAESTLGMPQGSASDWARDPRLHWSGRSAGEQRNRALCRRPPYSFRHTHGRSASALLLGSR